jgi:hypothetical protein
LEKITTFNDTILKSLGRDQNRISSRASGAHEWMKFMAWINANRCKSTN